MRSVRRSIFWLLVGAGAWTAGLATLASCGGDVPDALLDGSADGTLGGDAITTPPPDANADDGGEAGFADGGGGDAAMGDAAPDGSTSQLAFHCGTDGGAVATCAQCQGNPQPCVYCEADGGAALAGRCTTLGGSCYAGAPTGFALCTCGAGDAGSCAASYQVCRSQFCRTCSDSPQNNGLSCHGGGTCDATDGGCL